MKRKKQIRFIIDGALIAAAYVALTFFSSLFNLAYGQVQFRVSEVLTILPVFTPAAIPGLAVGCFIANIASFNMLDMIFGTLATLLAALTTYALRNIRYRGLPLLSMFPPVLFNAVIVGLEISIFLLPGGASLTGFLLSALQVGAGQLGVCYVLGVPFYMMVNKYRLFEQNSDSM